jgi:hypothetical protein
MTRKIRTYPVRKGSRLQDSSHASCPSVTERGLDPV